MKNKFCLYLILNSFLMSFEGDRHDFYLPNGLKVIIYEKHTHPTIAVNVAYDVGAHDDPIGQKGMAHVMARLMEEGSKNYKRKEHLAIVEGTGGESGFSWWQLQDYTEFRNTSTSDNLELLLKLESDRMSSLFIDSESLKNAKFDAISKIEEDMQSSFWEVSNAVSSIYPDNHPYSFNSAGSVDDIATISIEDCQTSYAKYFTPNNAILVVVGNVDPLNSFNLITKHLGHINSSESLPNNPNLMYEVENNNNINIFNVKNWPMSSYVEVFSVPNPRNKDSIVIDMMRSSFNLKSSYFHNFIESNDNFTRSFILFRQLLGNGYFGFVLESDTTATNFKKHKKTVNKFIKYLKKYGIAQSELDIAINKEMMQLYERNMYVGWTAVNLVRHEILFGDYNTYFDTAELYKNITNDDIKRVAKKYITDGYKFALKPPK